MHTEAKRLKIPTEGWTGGIVIDEMSIQDIALGSIHTCKNTSEIINLELINSFPK
jgi:hypothetical protein